MNVVNVKLETGSGQPASREILKISANAEKDGEIKEFNFLVFDPKVESEGERNEKLRKEYNAVFQDVGSGLFDSDEQRDEARDMWMDHHKAAPREEITTLFENFCLWCGIELDKLMIFTEVASWFLDLDTLPKPEIFRNLVNAKDAMEKIQFSY